MRQCVSHRGLKTSGKPVQWIGSQIHSRRAKLLPNDANKIYGRPRWRSDGLCPAGSVLKPHAVSRSMALAAQDSSLPNFAATLRWYGA
jgi:hypothetical protein